MRKLKVCNLNSAIALGVTAFTGGLLTQLTAQAPQNPAAATSPTTAQSAIEPPTFLDYQAGLREAAWKDKPLFVIFRCER